MLGHQHIAVLTFEHDCIPFISPLHIRSLQIKIQNYAEAGLAALTDTVSAVACCIAAYQCPWDQNPILLNYPAVGKPLNSSKDAPVVIVGLGLWEHAVFRVFFRVSPEYIWMTHIAWCS